MQIDIRPDHLAMVRSILRSFIPTHRVVAFGSRVKGTASKASDLDLCIMGSKPISFLTLSDLRDEFSLSNLPYKVDVIDWTTITPDFRELILKNCCEIQAENSTET